MKEYKKILIKIIAVIIIILIVILIIKCVKNFIMVKRMPITQDPNIETSVKLQKVDFMDSLIALDKCIKTYNSSLANKLGRKETLDLLDKEYKEYKRINYDNITEKIDFSYKYFNIREAYKKDIDKDKEVIYTYGILIDKKNKSVKNYGYIVKINKIESAFSIIPYDYMQYKKYIDRASLEKAALPNIDVKPNSNNSYKIGYNNSEKVAKFYYDLFKHDYIYDIEFAYNKLSGEYIKNNNYSLDKFKKNINLENTSKVNSVLVEEYRDKLKKFNCKDSSNNIIYFNVEEDLLDYYIEIK